MHVLRKHAYEQHRKRKVVERILQLVAGNKLQMGFKKWEQVRIGETKRRAGMCRILARMSCTLQSAALQRWLHAVGEGAVEREERLMEQRTDAIVQRLEDRRVRKVGVGVFLSVRLSMCMCVGARASARGLRV